MGEYWDANVREDTEEIIKALLIVIDHFEGNPVINKSVNNLILEYLSNRIEKLSE